MCADVGRRLQRSENKCKDQRLQEHTILRWVGNPDFLMTQYRTFILSRKWPLQVFMHAIDLFLSNAYMALDRTSLKSDKMQHLLPQKEMLHFLDVEHTL